MGTGASVRYLKEQVRHREVLFMWSLGVEKTWWNIISLFKFYENVNVKCMWHLMTLKIALNVHNWNSKSITTYSSFSEGRKKKGRYRSMTSISLVFIFFEMLNNLLFGDRW